MQLSTIEQLVRYWSREYDFGRVEARLNALPQVAQGGDVGAAVTDVMAIQAPDGLAGIQLNFLKLPRSRSQLPWSGPLRSGARARGQRAAFDALRRQFGKGYITEQRQSPPDHRVCAERFPRRSGGLILDHDRRAPKRRAPSSPRLSRNEDASGGRPPRPTIRFTTFWGWESITRCKAPFALTVVAWMRRAM